MLIKIVMKFKSQDIYFPLKKNQENTPKSSGSHLEIYDWFLNSLFINNHGQFE